MKIKECKASTNCKYCKGVYEEISNAVGPTDTVRYLLVSREEDFLEEQVRVPYLKITVKQFPTETDTCTQMHSHRCRYEKKTVFSSIWNKQFGDFPGKKKEVKRDISLDNTRTYDTYVNYVLQVGEIFLIATVCFQGPISRWLYTAALCYAGSTLETCATPARCAGNASLCMAT